MWVIFAQGRGVGKRREAIFRDFTNASTLCKNYTILPGITPNPRLKKAIPAN
jgi:hypothetical protein